MAAGFRPAAEDALYSWVENEYLNFEPNTGKCSGTCGHFTQAMWGNTQYVGCAMARIPTTACGSNCTKGAVCLPDLYGQGYGYIMACDYRRPGNCNGYRFNPPAGTCLPDSVADAPLTPGCNVAQPSLWKTNGYCSNTPLQSWTTSGTGDPMGCARACCLQGSKSPFAFASQKTDPFACFCMTDQNCGNFIADLSYEMYTVDTTFPDNYTVTTIPYSTATGFTKTAISSKTAWPTTTVADPCALKADLKASSAYCINGPPGTSLYSSDGTAAGCAKTCCKSNGNVPPFTFYVATANNACFCLGNGVSCNQGSYSGYAVYTVTGTTTTTEGFTRTTTTSKTTQTTTATTTATAFGCGSDQVLPSLIKQNYFCNGPPTRYTGNALTNTPKGCIDLCCALGFTPPYFFDYNRTSAACNCGSEINGNCFHTYLNFDIDTYKVDVVGYTKTTRTTQTYPVPTLTAEAIGACKGKLADTLYAPSARCSNMPNECNGWSQSDEKDCVRLCCNAGKRPPYYFSYSWATKQCFCMDTNQNCSGTISASRYETHYVIDVSNYTTVSFRGFWISFSRSNHRFRPFADKNKHPDN